MQNEELEKDDFQVEQAQPEVYRLGKSQKIMAVFLAFFAVFVVVMWGLQFKNNLNKPFTYTGDTTNLNNSATDNLSSEELKTKDADGDGVSDYDEINTYKTSPYLEDSDSDGINDKTEITQGTDPNCPTGQTCTTPITTDTTDSNLTNSQSATDSENSASTLDSLNQTGTSTQTTLSASDQEAMKSLFGQNMNAASLRQLLIQKGMSKSDLDKISDDELMKSFQETLNSQ